MTNSLRMYRAIVISTDDPQGLGRVQLSITRTVRKSPLQEEGWAMVANTPFGAFANARPVYSVGDTVLYAAERLPFAGAVVLCRETNGNATAEPFVLTLLLGPGNELTLEASNGGVRLSTTAGQQVTLHPNGFIEAAATEISLQANTLRVSAAAVTIDSGMVQFSGVVKCDSLITNSVVAASYTPGAGNIW